MYMQTLFYLLRNSILKDMKKTLLIVAALLGAATLLKAEVKMPSVFCDNMVIQRDTKAAIWGTATPGTKVTVKTTWSADVKTTIADAITGKWSLLVQTPAAGGPYEIRISEGRGTPLVLKNVLSGDVWFCSGQSNMEMPMRGYDCTPAAGATDKIVGAKASRPIRICKVKKESSAIELDDVTCTWQENVPQAVAEVSALAYFFADALQEVIEVPVGILVSSWGGSTIQTWISRDVIEREFSDDFNISDESVQKAVQNSHKNHRYPSLLYNGQVAGLVPYTFKGMLWYQGEANRATPELYTRMQTAYVAMMRKLFNVPDAPFYFVQISPYSYRDVDAFKSGYFCEAQQATLKTIPNSGMAVTIDLGEMENIHPAAKQEVAKRLAYLALSHTYGISAINADAPVYKSVDFKNDGIVVTVECGTKGVGPMGVNLSGFEVAGKDKVFFPAVAQCGLKGYKNNQIVLTCPAVSNPVAVRYCFRNWAVGTVFNNYGIPLAPFRTDNWDDLER